MSSGEQKGLRMLVKGTREMFDLLPMAIKVDVLCEFSMYDKCHTVLRNGKVLVEVDWVISSGDNGEPLMEFYKEDFSEDEIAAAYLLKYGEKFDRKAVEESVAEFYRY